MKPPARPLVDPTRSLEAALRFALASGAWVMDGGRDETRRGVMPGPEAETAPARIGDRDSASQLRAVHEDLGDCRRCRLWEGRTRLVFGVGSPSAELLFVGEGPGAEEDRKGEPFVGRAGQLLNLMIRAVGLDRGEVYIANVVKCRPPGNREPREDEEATCLPFLWRQIEAVRPRVICALGAHAAKSLLGADAAIGALRGRPQRARGWTVLPTYHPAYLLRNPLAKRLAWQDLKKVKSLLDGAV